MPSFSKKVGLVAASFRVTKGRKGIGRGRSSSLNGEAWNWLMMGASDSPVVKP